MIGGEANSITDSYLRSFSAAQEAEAEKLRDAQVREDLAGQAVAAIANDKLLCEFMVQHSLEVRQNGNCVFVVRLGKKPVWGREVPTVTLTPIAENIGSRFVIGDRLPPNVTYCVSSLDGYMKNHDAESRSKTLLARSVRELVELIKLNIGPALAKLEMHEGKEKSRA